MLEDMIKKTIDVFKKPTCNFKINYGTLEEATLPGNQKSAGYMTLQAFLDTYIQQKKSQKKILRKMINIGYDQMILTLMILFQHHQMILWLRNI